MREGNSGGVNIPVLVLMLMLTKNGSCGRVRARLWVGCCFMWNYTPCAQLSLTADLQCGFYRPTPTQSVKWLSGWSHFLLFAPGPPSRRCLNDTASNTELRRHDAASTRPVRINLGAFVEHTVLGNSASHSFGPGWPSGIISSTIY